MPEKMNLGRDILKVVVTTLVASSITWAVASGGVISRVSILEHRQTDMEHRIDKIVEVFDKIAEQNTLLITLVKVQQGQQKQP